MGMPHHEWPWSKTSGGRGVWQFVRQAGSRAEGTGKTGRPWRRGAPASHTNGRLLDVLPGEQKSAGYSVCHLAADRRPRTAWVGAARTCCNASLRGSCRYRLE